MDFLPMPPENQPDLVVSKDKPLVNTEDVTPVSIEGVNLSSSQAFIALRDVVRSGLDILPIINKEDLTQDQVGLISQQLELIKDSIIELGKTAGFMDMASLHFDFYATDLFTNVKSSELAIEQWYRGYERFPKFVGLLKHAVEYVSSTTGKYTPSLNQYRDIVHSGINMARELLNMLNDKLLNPDEEFTLDLLLCDLEDLRKASSNVVPKSASTGINLLKQAEPETKGKKKGKNNPVVPRSIILIRSQRGVLPSFAFVNDGKTANIVDERYWSNVNALITEYVQITTQDPTIINLIASKQKDAAKIKRSQDYLKEIKLESSNNMYNHLISHYIDENKVKFLTAFRDSCVKAYHQVSGESSSEDYDEMQIAPFNETTLLLGEINELNYSAAELAPITVTGNESEQFILQDGQLSYRYLADKMTITFSQSTLEDVLPPFLRLTGEQGFMQLLADLEEKTSSNGIISHKDIMTQFNAKVTSYINDNKARLLKFMKSQLENSIKIAKENQEQNEQ